jgi:RepB DNA-primase from phage plasmid
MAIDRDAPLRFLRTAFHPDDWVAVLLKSHDTGGTAQRVGPLSLVTHPRFQAWLRAQSARRFSVYVSVNAIRPQRKARTRDAIGDIRHVFLDADRDGRHVLAAIHARPDLPAPSYVLHSSPNRLHVLWRVTGFTRESVEALQKQLARELKTDKAATSCAQTTRLPGFFNHKYRPAPMVVAEYPSPRRVFTPADFPAADPTERRAGWTDLVRTKLNGSVVERARRYVAAIPPAVTGQHGDTDTFRVCCRLVRGFALDDDDALAVLSEWNIRCEPPWSLQELRGKLQGARRYGREPFGVLLTQRRENRQS